jgi:signal transduction histidine kinase
VDAFGLTLVMVAFLFVSAAFGGPWLAQIRWATFVVLGIAPIAFLTGLLHARLARSALGDLIVELHADLAPVDLRDALARTLRDPSLDLAYWLPDYATYADVDGQPVDITSLGRGRAMTLIERNGKRVGALLHDAWLQDEPELLGAATAAAGIALENGRLQAELRARVNELRASRARIVGAGDEERRRLERNLHDGAQQRLVALGMQLRLLESRIRTDPAAAEALVATAASELAISVDELRELARGIHPAVLDHGLTVALESLAARSTVSTAVSVDLHERLPEAVEVAAYFVASEALANVAKHAQATSVTINVARTAGGALVEVADDGVGGADDEAGSGLRGLADRVEALGGQLRINSPRGTGTTISAVIPCES